MRYAAPKRKSVFRESAPHLDGLMRGNGQDWHDRHSAAALAAVRTPGQRVLARKAERRLTDAQVAERAHYARLAAKAETARQGAAA